MKKSHKITLAVLIPVLAGTLTIIEKSISIYNQVKPKASEVPENVIVQKGIAHGIENNNNQQKAREIK